MSGFRQPSYPPSHSHAFCDKCKAIRLVTTDSLKYYDATREFVGGDIECVTCGNIIATLYKRVSA